MIVNSIPVTRLLALAVLFTALNAFKPVCIDDAFYHYHAEQIAHHPLDPYGFRIFQNDRPEPAVQALAPVMMQYWWAIGIRIFGQHPFWWKVWLFPYALLLVFSLHSLLRRFAGRHEMTLTAMLVLSPVFLPSFNLMLDVPSAALILFALGIFLRASDRESLGLAAVAGLVAGIAAQTKYNGLVAPVVMLLYAILFKRIRLGIVAAVVAGAFFLLWEGFIFSSAGRSHFLAQSQTYGSVNLMAKYAYLSWPLVTIMGAVAPFFALLALIALGIRRTWTVVAAMVIAVGFLLIAFAPTGFQEWGGHKQFTLAHVIFSAFGICFFAGLLFVIKRLLLNAATLRSTLNNLAEYKFELFLTGWWLLEIFAYFLLSPIPAVRRMLLLLVVSTLLIGRLLAHSQTVTVRAIRWVAVGSVVLGLLFYIVDFRDAYVEKAAIDKARRTIATMPSAGSTWYLGRWGLQFYGEQAGMKPVLPDESDLRPGDFVVTTDSVYAPEPVLAHLRRYQMNPVTEFALADRLPLSTMLGFYNSGIPIHHQDGPRRRVKIYRIE
ncbi:MAG: hypothetical protein QOE77_1299 [Blastocatellia bacterium]|jgi:hypothetical protein|nr:hypothetical protein [Blastocatellia bacterium]